MGGVDQFLVKVSWLGKLALVFLWVELDLFSLECNEVFNSEFWGVYGFGMLWEACILMFRAVFLHCWRISMVCLVLELVGSWVVLGFSVGMEAFW